MLDQASRAPLQGLMPPPAGQTLSPPSNSLLHLGMPWLSAPLPLVCVTAGVRAALHCCCRPQEHASEGDSVTKLHVDLSDAVNVLVHMEGQSTLVRCGSTPADPKADPT